METWRRAIQAEGTASAKAVGWRELVLPTTRRRLLWQQSSPRGGQWGGR